MRPETRNTVGTQEKCVEGIGGEWWRGRKSSQLRVPSPSVSSTFADPITSDTDLQTTVLCPRATQLLARMCPSSETLKSTLLALGYRLLESGDLDRLSHTSISKGIFASSGPVVPEGGSSDLSTV